MRILYFLGLLLLGILSILYTQVIVKVFGRIAWAERTFGPTGTYTLWKLVGLALIILGMVILRTGALGIV